MSTPAAKWPVSTPRWPPFTLLYLRADMDKQGSD
jgi:hypothetical protein